MKAITQPQPTETNPRGRRGRKGRGGKRRGRKGRRRNPSKNPSALTWVLIAGGSALAVGGLGALYIRRRNKKALPPTVTPPGGGGGGGGTQPGGGGGGGTGGGGSKNYVGSSTGWTNWPHKDAFPTASTMIVTMGNLGYPMSGNFMDTPSPQSVHQFQVDYNRVVKTPGLSPAGSPIGVDSDVVKSGPHAGDHIGFMGTQGVNALWNALQWIQLKPWSQLKQEAP